MTQKQSKGLRYRRGDPSPVDAGLLFFRYKRNKEVWVTRERFEHLRELKKIVQARQRSKPEHKEKMKTYFRTYNHIPKQKSYRSSYYKQPKVRALIRHRWATDPEMRRKSKEYSRSFEAMETRRQYREGNKELIASKKKYYRQSRKHLPLVRLEKNLRNRIRGAVYYAGTRKLSKSVILLGCSFDYFRKWIEPKWKKGMSWLNYGHFWHIDHIFPVVSFDLSTLAGQLQCFRFTNTQPLWKDENLSKGAKLIFA